MAVRFLLNSKEAVRKALLAVDLLVQILGSAGYCRVFCAGYCRVYCSELLKFTWSSAASLSARLRSQSRTVRLSASSSRRYDDTDLCHLVKREAVSPRQAMVRDHVSFFGGSLSVSPELWTHLGKEILAISFCKYFGQRCSS